MQNAGGFLNPVSIVANLNIQPGWKVADFGSGSGYFTLPLAKAVGEEGVVTAVDVLKEKLETIKNTAQTQGLFNINYVRANLEILGGSHLDDESQDVVILANVLFQSQKKEDIVRESRRALKPGGELAVIDWEVSAGLGPKETGWKLSKEEAQNLIGGLGFELVREIPAADNHWGLLFKKVR